MEYELVYHCVPADDITPKCAIKASSTHNLKSRSRFRATKFHVLVHEAYNTGLASRKVQDLYYVFAIKNGILFDIFTGEKLKNCWSGLHRMYNVWDAFRIIGPLWGESTGHRSPVESRHKELMMRAFNVIFVASPSKVLSKQTRCRWFETPWRSCDVTVMVGRDYIIWRRGTIKCPRFLETYTSNLHVIKGCGRKSPDEHPFIDLFTTGTKIWLTKMHDCKTDCCTFMHYIQYGVSGFNPLRPSDTYASVSKPSLVQITACRLVHVGAKPLSEPMVEYTSLPPPPPPPPRKNLQRNFIGKLYIFNPENAYKKMSFAGGHFVSASCKMVAILSRPPAKWWPFCIGLLYVSGPVNLTVILLIRSSAFQIVNDYFCSNGSRLWTDSCHTANFVINGGTTGCYSDNFRCSH